MPSRAAGSPEPLRVSVVIATRNRARYVGDAIASALRQSRPVLEVVVVDDASTDETPRVLADLAGRDARMRTLRREERGGAPRARNAGAANARGDVIAFLDDDCVWAPEKLERQLPRLTEDCGVVYCRQAIRDPDGQWVIGGEPGAAERGVNALLRTNYIGTCALVVRRDVFNAVGGFDERLPRLQDWELLLRLAERTRFAFEPEILLSSVLVEGGISLTPGPLVAAAERILEVHESRLTRRQLAALSYGLGKFLLVDGLTAAARRLMRRSIRLDPFSATSWAGLAATTLGPSPARFIRDRRRRAARAEVGAGFDPAKAYEPGASPERGAEPR